MFSTQRKVFGSEYGRDIALMVPRLSLSLLAENWRDIRIFFTFYYVMLCDMFSLQLNFFFGILEFSGSRVHCPWSREMVYSSS